MITLDGPSCSGKGTLSRLIAHKLGWLHIDSGLFYRAIACVYTDKGLSEITKEQLTLISKVLSCTVKDSQVRFFIEGVELQADKLRSVHTSKWSSILAQQPLVRQLINPMIRQIAQEASCCVADGRDMASVVFPAAQWKFYLTASVKVRAQRRWEQLQQQGFNLSLSEVESQLVERDKRDTTRDFDPLTMTEDSILIDTSELSEEQAIKSLLSYLQPDLAPTS